MAMLAPRYATDWVRMLARAMRGEGMAVHFQPIVDLHLGEVVGHEALLRFPGHPITSPAEWFEAAHAHGCGAELEALALHLALDARSDLPPQTFLSVNVAPGVLTHPAVREALTGAAGLEGVVVELTEHSRVEHYGLLDAELERIRSAGGAIAVDDTGAGYAGLHHLISVRPEMIKLDRTLVAGIDRDRPRRALVEMFGAFANRFDAWVLAEGVETAGELGTLRQIGVPLAQGYLLGRPTDGWSGVSEEARDHLRSLPSGHEGDSLRLLLEPATEPVHDDRDGLRLDVDTPLSEAAHRALNREPDRRWDPVLCTHGDGPVVGTVRMERIVEQLAVSARNLS